MTQTDWVPPVVMKVNVFLLQGWSTSTYCHLSSSNSLRCLAHRRLRILEVGGSCGQDVINNDDNTVTKYLLFLYSNIFLIFEHVDETVQCPQALNCPNMISSKPIGWNPREQCRQGRSVTRKLCTFYLKLHWEAAVSISCLGCETLWDKPPRIATKKVDLEKSLGADVNATSELLAVAGDLHGLFQRKKFYGSERHATFYSAGAGVFRSFLSGRNSVSDFFGLETTVAWFWNHKCSASQNNFFCLIRRHLTKVIMTRSDDVYWIAVSVWRDGSSRV